MDPQNNIIEPTNKSHRIIFTVITILLTSAVVGGSLWYVMDKQAKEQQKQIEDLNKKVEDSKKSEKKVETKKEEVKTEIKPEIVVQKDNSEVEVRKLIETFLSSYKSGGSLELFNYFTDSVTQEEKDDRARWSTCNNLAGNEPGGPCWGANSGSKKIISYKIDEIKKNNEKYVVKVTETMSFWGGSPGSGMVKTIFEIKKVESKFLIDKYHGVTDNEKYSGFGEL